MIQLIDLSYVADDGIEILKNINLTIDDEKMVVITGPNGGGKSTLAKIIAGILNPTSGKILFNGKDITKMNITERAKIGISFAFQQPVRFKGITVRDLITLAANKEIKTEEIYGYLEKVGLNGDVYINREVNGSLSGGEMKRIEIAMIMAKDTELYVFDEPEAGIDIWSFKDLVSVFREIRATTKKSMIIISHQERIMDISDEIVVLSDGQVLSHEKREDILPCLLGNSRVCCNKKLEVKKDE
ncbi:MAG: ATP-binding cassette domain-containing protein [Clostridium sp.]|nr:ATP-binding cassette domain-containing protein [Clostridium sp.]MCI7442587.1 ATP-binding cassette domain-containing protein [Clostridium sp.]